MILAVHVIVYQLGGEATMFSKRFHSSNPTSLMGGWNSSSAICASFRELPRGEPEIAPTSSYLLSMK